MKKKHHIEHKDASGLLHKDDGPAVITDKGDKFYYKHGLINRSNGPAIIMVDGTKIYCKNNLPHRIDGAAKIFPNGEREYWINGFRLKNVKSVAELVIYVMLNCN